MFNAWSIKNIQDLRTLLTHVQGHGVTTVGEALQLLEGTLDDVVVADDAAREKEAKRFSRATPRQKRRVVSAKPCPACATGILMPVVTYTPKTGAVSEENKGVKILGCKKCKYSEVVA